MIASKEKEILKGKNMFLHIGNDFIIEKQNIIGIFNLDTIKKNEKNKTIKVCKENEKTSILYKKENEIIEYITNISTTTLAKRINLY